jgi:hypothetical protein
VGFGLVWLGYLIGKGGIVMGLISEIMDRGRWWRRYDGWSDHKGRDFLFSLLHYLQLWFFSFLFFLFICSLTLKFFILPILFLHSNFALTFFLHISSLSFFSLFLLWVLFIYTPLYSSIPSYPFTFSNLSYLSTLLFFFFYYYFLSLSLYL